MKRKFDYTFRALWSLFVITFFREDDGGLDDFVQTVFKRISHFETEFSRFVPDSSLSVLNRVGRFSVSDEFLELLAVSGECYHRSSGYFNPLRNVALLGYSDDFESGNFVPEIPVSPPRTDFENVRTEGNEVVLLPWMKLDFWAVGKGFLAEKTADFFRKSGYSDAILNFWGDVFVIWGNATEAFHRVAITSPFEEGWVFATLDLTDVSVSSSGSYLRKWKVGEDEFRHIVFPTTVPAGEECASVTVVDPSGAVSDAFATALFAAWAAKGLEIAVSAGIDALIVKDDRQVVTTPGFVEKYGLRSNAPSA